MMIIENTVEYQMLEDECDDLRKLLKRSYDMLRQIVGEDMFPTTPEEMTKLLDDLKKVVSDD